LRDYSFATDNADNPAHAISYAAAPAPVSGGQSGVWDWQFNDVTDLHLAQPGGRGVTNNVAKAWDLHYIWSDLDESCHEACSRYGDDNGLGNLYCDHESMFNIDVKETMNMEEQLGFERCVNIHGPEFDNEGDANPSYVASRAINKVKGSAKEWSPYARWTQSRQNNAEAVTDTHADQIFDKCYWATARGTHTCYKKVDKNWRLCGCDTYANMNPDGDDYERLDTTVVRDASEPEGWHAINMVTCNAFCDRAQFCDGEWKDEDCGSTPMGLTCDNDVMNSVAGFYHSRDLEQMFQDMGVTEWTCDVYRDVDAKQNNPQLRDMDKTCWTTPLHDQNTGNGCSLMSRGNGLKGCYCN